MSLANAENAPRKDSEVIGLVGLAHATSHFFQLMLPPLFPWLMQEFSLSFSAVGLLMTVFFVVSGVGQALAGFLVDRFGARPILLSGLGLLGVSGLLLASAQSPLVLALATAVAGLGNAVFHPADYTLLNRQVSAKRLGHAFSTHGLTGTLGWAASPVVMFFVANTVNWRAAALLAAIIAFVSLLVLQGHRALRDQPGDSHPSTKTTGNASAPTRDGLFGYLRSREVWVCFTFFLFWTMAFSALQNFAPSILQNMYGVSLAAATSAVTAYMLGSAAGTIGGGFLVAGVAADRLVAAGLLVAALIALLLASGAVTPWGVIPLMVAMGFGAGIAGPSRDMLVRRAAVAGATTASYGRIYGFVYSGLDSGLALSPLLFGQLMDASRFALVMVGIAVFQGLAVCTALWVGGRVAGSLQSQNA